MHVDHHHLTDQELLDKYYQDQDINWIGFLLERYTLLLFGVGMKYLANEEAAKDIVQQVFLKALTEIQKYKVTFFKSWLYMIAKNQCLMQLRSKGLKITELSENISSESNTDLDLTELNKKEFLYQELHHAILELPEDQQKCIKAFYLDKKSYQIISDETGMTLKKVKSNIQNGKRNLKIKIEKINLNPLDNS